MSLSINVTERDVTIQAVIWSRRGISTLVQFVATGSHVKTRRPRIPVHLTYVCMSIAGSGLVSSLEAQAAKWARMPFAIKARKSYARTLNG